MPLTDTARAGVPLPPHVQFPALLSGRTEKPDRTITKPPANVLELPIEVRAEMALKAAVEKVIIEHARLGLPIYVMRDGQIVEVPREELRLQAARLLAE